MGCNNLNIDYFHFFIPETFKSVNLQKVSVQKDISRPVLYIFQFKNISPPFLKTIIISNSEEPCGRDRRAHKLNICFQCHSRLSGILPTLKGLEERFWTSQNDRNRELRQGPQGVIFIR